MRKYLIFLIIFIALFFGLTVYLPAEQNSRVLKEFEVVKGQGTKEIAFNLKKENLIISDALFRVYVLTFGISGKLQAGAYELSPGMSIVKIAQKMASGDVLKEKITIIEGWNLRDIGFYFEGKGMFQAEELWEIAGFPSVDYSKAWDLPAPKDFSLDYSFLAGRPDNIGLEGYLFPDTYQIDRGAGIEEIIRKMLDNFEKKVVSGLEKEIAGQSRPLFDILTMASLLEKEVKTFEDKKIVAGILWKRLGIGMPLQVDASITYITGGRTSKISAEQTQIDSLFNTYKYTGLPLGPICNPGLESVLAALRPETSEYWYYLSTREGETIFSETLEQHNIAKAKYLK